MNNHKNLKGNVINKKWNAHVEGAKVTEDTIYAVCVILLLYTQCITTERSVTLLVAMITKKPYSPVLIVIVGKEAKPAKIRLVKPGESYSFEGHRQYLETVGPKV